MDGKCNKAPNTGSSNTSNTKYMDHVYCHPSQTKTTYGNNNSMTNNNGNGTSADILALLKENKQLKSMLILHLDLIQEQSDQLMAKDKALITQNDELEKLRARNAALENHVLDLQRQIKRSGEVSTLPPPPLAKIQCKLNVSNVQTVVHSANGAKNRTANNSQSTSNIIGVCNGKLINKIVLRGKQRTHSPQSQTTDSENEDDYEEHEENYEEADVENDEDEVLDEEEEEEEEDDDENDDRQHTLEDEPNDEDLNEGDDEVSVREVELGPNTLGHGKIVQSHVVDDSYDTEDSNEILAVQSKRLRLKQAAKQSLALPRGAKPSVSPASIITNDGKTTFKAVTTTSSTHLSVTTPTVSRGKQMSIMQWHAPDYHSDESVSCDSAAETEKRSTSVTSCSPPKPSTNNHHSDKKRYQQSHDVTHSHSRLKVRKCSYISTPHMYSTREWEDEAFNCDQDFEILKTEAKLLQADAPKLEIPKWTEHELTPSYCIEGTEDLSDDIFLKRHAKLEVDEKRRKKWDVQQIREQRRIERLKRRHCKDEIQNTQDSAMLHSFYPTTDSLQTICFVQDLPVQAFGEMIPRLSTSTSGERKDFLLPWLEKAQLQHCMDSNKKPTVSTVTSMKETSTTSSQIQNQLLNSSFVMLKKRKRQQSSNFGPQQSSRQRSLAARLTVATSAISVTPAITTVNTTSMSVSVTSCNVTNAATTTTTTTICSSNLNPRT